MKIFSLLLLTIIGACASKTKKSENYLYTENQCLNWKGQQMIVMEVEKTFQSYSLYGVVLGDEMWHSERKDYVHWQMFPNECSTDFIQRYRLFKQRFN